MTLMHPRSEEEQVYTRLHTRNISYIVIPNELVPRAHSVCTCIVTDLQKYTKIILAQPYQKIANLSHSAVPGHMIFFLSTEEISNTEEVLIAVRDRKDDIEIIYKRIPGIRRRLSYRN